MGQYLIQNSGLEAVLRTADNKQQYTEVSMLVSHISMHHIALVPVSYQVKRSAIVISELQINLIFQLFWVFFYLGVSILYMST